MTEDEKGTSGDRKARSRADFSMAYELADKSSTVAQRRFLGLTKIRLLALIAAGLCGYAGQTEQGSSQWWSIGAALAFLLSVYVEVQILRDHPERTWYEGRAGAESVKTLCWRFAVCGKPFDTGLSDRRARELFLGQVKGVFDVLRHLELVAVPPSEQITEWMKESRESSLRSRVNLYRDSRVNDQQDWYLSKAEANFRLGRKWRSGILACELLGAVGVIVAWRAPLVGLISLFALLAAAGTGWTQTKRYEDLAVAYSVTATEVGSISDGIGAIRSEAEWAEFVDDSEEAFSREHTLWRASRGIQSI